MLKIRLKYISFYLWWNEMFSFVMWQTIHTLQERRLFSNNGPLCPHNDDVSCKFWVQILSKLNIDLLSTFFLWRYSGVCFNTG